MPRLTFDILRSYNRTKPWYSDDPTSAQLTALGIMFTPFKVTRDIRLLVLGAIFGRTIRTTYDLTKGEINTLLTASHNPKFTDDLNDLITATIEKVKETLPHGSESKPQRRSPEQRARARQKRGRQQATELHPSGDHVVVGEQ